MTSRQVCDIRRDKTPNLRQQYVPSFSRSSGSLILVQDGPRVEDFRGEGNMSLTNGFHWVTIQTIANKKPPTGAT